MPLLFRSSPLKAHIVLLFFRDKRKSLQQGLEMLALGGKLIYTTFPYNAVKNEAVIM